MRKSESWSCCQKDFCHEALLHWTVLFEGANRSFGELSCSMVLFKNLDEA